MALAMVATQVEAQRQLPGRVLQPTLGWLYITEDFAPFAASILRAAQGRWPAVSWVGGVAHGVIGTGAEYLNEPALALMLSDIPPSEFRVFSGMRPLTQVERAGFEANTAQIHADPHTADLEELITEMSGRTQSGYLFGGLVNAQDDEACIHFANGVFTGGLSGVAFSKNVPCVSRVTQGCQPVGPARLIGEAENNLVYTLDGQPALDCLLDDLQLSTLGSREALSRLRHTMAGLTSPGDAAIARTGTFGTDTRVRELIGFEPTQRGIAVADDVRPGMHVTFCTRNPAAARRDLVRICAEIREELDGDPEGATPRSIAGAMYVSCIGRGGSHFGSPNAEMAIIQHALGDVPLVGFFAAGEIAHHHLYGYTAVLTVWSRDGLAQTR